MLKPFKWPPPAHTVFTFNICPTFIQLLLWASTSVEAGLYVTIVFRKKWICDKDPWAKEPTWNIYEKHEHERVSL